MYKTVTDVSTPSTFVSKIFLNQSMYNKDCFVFSQKSTQLFIIINSFSYI